MSTCTLPPYSARSYEDHRLRTTVLEGITLYLSQQQAPMGSPMMSSTMTQELTVSQGGMRLIAKKGPQTKDRQMDKYTKIHFGCCIICRFRLNMLSAKQIVQIPPGRCFRKTSTQLSSPWCHPQYQHPPHTHSFMRTHTLAHTLLLCGEGFPMEWLLLCALHLLFFSTFFPLGLTTCSLLKDKCFLIGL